MKVQIEFHKIVEERYTKVQLSNSKSDSHLPKKIVLFSFMCLFINLFKVDSDKKDSVYKNTYRIAWG